jgi:hypothetical protein
VGRFRQCRSSQIRQIADSIARFGFTNPVLIDDDDKIIAGHGRLEAAKLLGLKGVPTLRLSGLDATERNRRDWLWMTQALWGRGTVFNLDPDRGDFSRVESLRLLSGVAARQSEADGLPFFSAVGLRFGLRFRDQAPLPGYRRFGGDAYQDWDERGRAAGRAAAERWREAGASRRCTRSAARPRRAGARNRAPRERDRTASAIRFEERGPDRIVLRTESADPTWLFALRGFWSYRRSASTARRRAVPSSSRSRRCPCRRVRTGSNGAKRCGLTVSRWGPALFAVLAGLLAPRRTAGKAKREQSHVTSCRLLFALLVAAVYTDPLVTHRTFIGRDIVPYNPPLEKSVHDAWSRGRLPVWWNEISGGRPLMPNPNAGVFYPVRPVLSLVDFPTAMRIYPVFHWVLAGWGMLLLLGAYWGLDAAAWWERRASRFRAMVAEVFYELSSRPRRCPGRSGSSCGRSGGRSTHPARGRRLRIAVSAGDAFSVAPRCFRALWLVLERRGASARRPRDSWPPACSRPRSSRCRRSRRRRCSPRKRAGSSAASRWARRSASRSRPGGCSS